MGAGHGIEHFVVNSRRLLRLTGHLRINFFVKSNAKTVILHPSNTSVHTANIAQFHFNSVSPLNAQGPFAHHPAIRQIANLYAMVILCLFNPHSGEQQKAVTRKASCFNSGHRRPVYYLPPQFSIALGKY